MAQFSSFQSYLKLLYRLDYQGQKVKINTLGPQTAYLVQTHPSHPWIFRDADTNESLVIKKLNVKGNFFESSNYLVLLTDFNRIIFGL